MRTELVTALKRQTAELLSQLKRDEGSILITQHGVRRDYLVYAESFKRLTQRIAVLEGIAHGKSPSRTDGWSPSGGFPAHASVARVVRGEPALHDVEAIADYIALDQSDRICCATPGDVTATSYSVHARRISVTDAELLLICVEYGHSLIDIVTLLTTISFSHLVATFLGVEGLARPQLAPLSALFLGPMSSLAVGDAGLARRIGATGAEVLHQIEQVSSNLGWLDPTFLSSDGPYSGYLYLWTIVGVLVARASP